MSRRIERVVIVGRDAACWMAALALHRALGRTGVEIRVVELPSLLRGVDVYAALPSLAAFHTLVRLQDKIVMGACGGAPMVAQRFANWAKSRPPFLHGYDVEPPGERDIDFLQYWVKARGAGLRVELEDFSLAAVAAKQGRVPASDSPTSFAATAGYHLDARSYVELLRQVALHSGVAHQPGVVGSVEVTDGRIAGIVLGDGSLVTGDLFIDASGPEGTLIRRMPGDEFESWRRWLPCDRLLAASAAKLDPLPAFSQISAFRAGWLGLYPLQERTAVVAAYNSADFSDDNMRESLGILSGLRIGSEAFVAPLHPGARPRPWIGNCVAIGEAAVALEPLDAVQLHLAHIGLSHLITLFPVDADDQPEAEAFNAGIASHARNIRDFQIAHYALNRRYDEPFWDAVRDPDGPEGLRAKLDLFASRGQIALYDDETFQEQNWSAIFVGHGVIPRSHDPRIDILPGEEHFAKVQTRLRDIAADVMAMPSVREYLDSCLPEPSERGAFEP